MNVDAIKPCPHYQIYSEQLNRDGPPAYLAIRHCMLTERSLRFLDQYEEGRQLREQLMVSMGEGRRYAFIGNDLEPVTHRSCNTERCENRCTPAYVRTLQHFGIVDPKEEEVTCDTPDNIDLPVPAA